MDTENLTLSASRVRTLQGAKRVYQQCLLRTAAYGMSRTPIDARFQDAMEAMDLLKANWNNGALNAVTAFGRV